MSDTPEDDTPEDDTAEDVRKMMSVAFLAALLGAGNLEDLHQGLSEARAPKTSNLRDYVLVAAIDFGTTFSGYAFSFKSHKEEINMNKNWGAEVGFSSYKTPTSVLVDCNEKFYAFGYEAQQKFADMSPEEAQEYFFFERFKMTLFSGKDLNTKMRLEAKNGKSLPAIKVFAMALEYMKDHLLDAVNSGAKSDLDPTLIRWVITVPAIWSDSSKQFMKEAALMAGLVETENTANLLIALEPEAASLYVRKQDIERVQPDEDASVNSLTIKPGTKYLVVDAGGGTLDVTAHELLQNGHVKELHFATGGALGGTEVDANFVKLLEELFGKDIIIKFQQNHQSEWFQFISDFEKRKRASSGQISINLPYSLIPSLTENGQRDINDILKASSKKGTKFANGALRIGNETVDTLFKPVTDAIVTHIKKILSEEKLKDIEYLFCVGGFNDARHLRIALKDTFSPNYTLLFPDNVSLAVVMGAVQFGHSPNVICSRVSPKTYGVEAVTDFIPIIHNPNKMLMANDQLICKDIFSLFVFKGQELPAGFSQSHRFTPLSEESTECTVQVYSSDQPRVKYITDDGVTHVADITVKWDQPGKDRSVEITMTFGGTEIDVKAVTYPGEKTAEATINFMTD